MISKLFTFIVDYDGGIYVSQHEAKNLRDAVHKFSEYVEGEVEIPLNKKEAKKILGEDEFPVPLDGGLVNTWCASCYGNNGSDRELAIINIILTESQMMRVAAR